MELQSLPTVPAGSVAGMIFSLAVAFGLPIGLYLYLKHKKYARTSSFVAGMAVFVLFAMVLETLVHSLVFRLTGTAITGSLFLYAVYAGLMAAAFEETGRYLAMRFVLRHRFDGKNALMYGAGHGGVEAMPPAGGWPRSTTSSIRRSSTAARCPACWKVWTKPPRRPFWKAYPSCGRLRRTSFL